MGLGLGRATQSSLLVQERTGLNELSDPKVDHCLENRSANRSTSH